MRYVRIFPASRRKHRPCSVGAEVHGAGDAFGANLHGLALNNGDAARKGRFGVVKRIGGLAAGVIDLLVATGNDHEGRGHCNAHIRGVAIGGVVVDGKPARRIHQVGEVVLDGGELDAEDGRVFGARKPAVIAEGERGGLAFGQRVREVEAYGEILGRSRGGDLASAGIDDARNVQCVIQLERGAGEIVQGNELHLYIGRQRLGSRIHVGVDGVMFDVNAISRGSVVGAEERYRAGGEGDQDCPTKHEPIPCRETQRQPSRRCR